MQKIFLAILLVSLGLVVRAQDAYESVLTDIETNSLTLAALREQAEAEKLNINTGRFLSNPEVEFAYLWGDPTAIGNRYDLNVTQTFDFPSAYSFRGNIVEQEVANAELRYKEARLDLLVEARNTCVELVYYNALAEEYAKRLENAEAIAKACQRQFAEGAVSVIENNKAQLNVVSVRNEMSVITMQREVLLAKLKSLNGGKDISFELADFNTPLLPADFENWYAEAEVNSPVLQQIKGQVIVADANVRLNKAMTLPKFSAGYMSENVVGEQYRGVKVGVSVPLWENKNTIKQAKAGALASKSALEDAQIQYYHTLQGWYLQATTLQAVVEDYRESLDSFSNVSLLKRALDSGELSLLDYLLEVQYYYEAFENYLATQRDMEYAYAKLWAASFDASNI